MPSADADRPALVWFRDDLRLADNPALAGAVATGRPVLCVFVHDAEPKAGRPLGGAALWWLHHALAALSKELETRGGRLDLLAGPEAETILAVAQSANAAAIFWNRRYHKPGIDTDTIVKAELKARGVEASSHNAHLLYEPWTVKTKTGDPVKVFTPFWRAARALGDPATPIPAPRHVPAADWHANTPARAALADLNLLPTKPDWAGGFREAWVPGEVGAARRLQDFLDEGFDGYAEDRNRPDLPSTSRLSPYLRFGEISPRQIWHAASLAVSDEKTKGSQKGLDKFLSEIGWREFAYHLLFHNPDLARTNFQPRFDGFPWERNEAALVAWQRGRTGYPIVDAGMRELWTTGWMHNRVRMIVASFLIKHLLIDWRIGEDWFWDTLVDADPANNAASWQWVAGSGADAAPYFRVFNPVLQGEKFDPDGDYVRRWVPELRGLRADVIHKPWTASAGLLAGANVKLGHTYPRPIVDHDAARQRALDAFQAIKAVA